MGDTTSLIDRTLILIEVGVLVKDKVSGWIQIENILQNMNCDRRGYYFGRYPLP
jgi:hypothetical protein